MRSDIPPPLGRMRPLGTDDTAAWQRAWRGRGTGAANRARRGLRQPARAAGGRGPSAAVGAGPDAGPAPPQGAVLQNCPAYLPEHGLAVVPLGLARVVVWSVRPIDLRPLCSTCRPCIHRLWLAYRRRSSSPSRPWGSAPFRTQAGHRSRRRRALPSPPKAATLARKLWIVLPCPLFAAGALPARIILGAPSFRAFCNFRLPCDHVDEL